MRPTMLCSFRIRRAREEAIRKRRWGMSIPARLLVGSTCRPPRRPQAVGLSSSRDLGASEGWDLDVDGQRRDTLATFHFDLHLVAFDLDVLGDHRQDLLPQNLNEPRVTDRGALVREQDRE